MLGDKVVLRIDVASKMPVSQTFTQVSPLGDTPTTVLFQDWREVDAGSRCRSASSSTRRR
jgi:hypothetical protein